MSNDFIYLDCSEDAWSHCGVARIHDLQEMIESSPDAAEIRIKGREMARFFLYAGLAGSEYFDRICMLMRLGENRA